MEDWKELQRQAYQNKVDHGFNVTDVPMEFCLLYGEVGEAYQAWSCLLYTSPSPRDTR